VLPDEASDVTARILDKVTEAGAWVPSLWHLEVANGLTMAVRRARISAEFRNSALADLASLDIRVDPQTHSAAWMMTLSLADRFGLTLYDAAYLELALRRNLPLATFDSKLADAGLKAGVGLFV